MPYSKFLGLFPKVEYNINNDLYGTKEKVTDIFFRVAFIKETLKDIASYYVYEVQDGDSPEVLAELVYGDPGAHWMILYANDIQDPQFDWYMDYSTFQRYVAEKYRPYVANSVIETVIVDNAGEGYSNGYISFEGGSGVNANARIVVDGSGSISNVVINNLGNSYFFEEQVIANVSHLGGVNAAITVTLTTPTDQQVLNYTQSTTHHYEKVVERTDTFSSVPQETRFTVNKNTLTNGVIYVTTTGDFQVGEMAYIGDLGVGNKMYGANIQFSGTVQQWQNSNGHLVLANTTGDLVLYNTIKGNISQTEANVARTSFDDKPFEYFENLAQMAYYQKINFDNISAYAITQITRTRATSIYDWEEERNEDRRFIRVIKAEYYPKVKQELNDILEKNDIMQTRLRRTLV